MDACAVNGFFSPAQIDKYSAAVPKRRSVRAFKGDPDIRQMSALHYAAARLALPGVRIALGEASAGDLYRRLPLVETIHGSRRYAAVIADKEIPHAAIHAGISGEAFILEAVAMGLGTCWVAAFKRGGVNVPIEEGEKVKAVIALGVPEEGVGPRKRKKLTEICASDPSNWPFWAYNAAEYVRIAPSAVNLQPWRLSFARRTLALSSARSNASLDMGIAMLHMTLGARDKPHVLRWGEGKEIAALIAEDRL
ncbi:MAG: nitroreductase family protein [Clostridia bacterium]|nr:nitroreductase family protein [Clostridia bacterium]